VSAEPEALGCSGKRLAGAPIRRDYVKDLWFHRGRTLEVGDAFLTREGCALFRLCTSLLLSLTSLVPRTIDTEGIDCSVLPVTELCCLGRRLLV